MSDAIGTAKIAITADASGVEVGTTKAKRSLATLGPAAEKAGSQMAAGTERAQKAIDAYIARVQQSAATLGKSAREVKLFELAQRGATQEQLRLASAAFQTIDAFKRQEAAAARVAQAGQLAGRILAAGFLATSAAAVAMGRSAVNSLDAMNDLSDATGSSIEKISALDRVARENGAGFETVAGILTKFNKVLNDTDEESQKAGQVLKALGLNVAELKRLDPSDALHKTAVAMSRFAADGDRARAVQLLFGRSVGELAPLLKDLSEKQELVGATSTKAAQDAEAFNKNLFALQANVQDLARSLVGDLLPAMNQLFQKGRDEGFLALLGFDKQFFRSADLSGKANDVRRLTNELNALKAAAVRGTPGLESQIEAVTKDLERAKRVFNDAAGRGVVGTSTAGAGRGTLNPPLVTPSIGAIPDGKKPPAGSKVSEAQRYLESLQKQLQGTRELTVLETLLDDIQNKRIDGLNPKLQQALESTARQVDVSRAQARALDEATRARERNTAMQQAADEAAAASADQLAATNEQLRQEIEMLGVEKMAQAAIEQARISATIALKEQQLIMLQNAEASAGMIGGLEREIALLRERRELVSTKASREQLLEIRGQEQDRVKQLNADLKAAFEDAFTNGTRNPLKAFGEALAQTMYQRATSALAEALANALSQQVLGGLLGGGGVPPNPFAGGGGIAGLITSVLGLFFHRGGVVGVDGDARPVDPRVFAGARRFHRGGLAGDEVPAILQRGEMVLTRAQTGALMNVGARQFHSMASSIGGNGSSSSSGGGNIHIVNNTTGRVDRAERRTTPDGDQVIVLLEAVAASMNDPNSKVSRSMKSNFGLTRNR